MKRTLGTFQEHTCLLYTTHILSTRFTSPLLVESGKQFSVFRLSAKWRSQIHTTDQKTLLLVSYSVVGVLIKRPNILHLNGRHGVLIAKRLGERRVVVYYYASLLCEDPTQRQHPEWNPGEYMMAED